MEKRGEERFESILLILLGRLGDVVITTALADSFRREHPRSRLTWLVGSDALPLLAGHPSVHCVLTPGEQTEQDLRRSAWDLVVNLDRSREMCALAGGVRALVRRGFGRDESDRLIAFHPSADRLVEINRNAAFRSTTSSSWIELYHQAAGLAFPDPPPRPTLPRPLGGDLARTRLRDQLGVTENEILVLISVGSHWKDLQKRWPPDRFARLAEELDSEPGIRPYLFAGSHEAAYHSAVIALCSARSLSSSGVSSLTEVLDHVRAADIVVSGDSLVAHVADALSKPSVLLFGPTNPAGLPARRTTTKLRGFPQCPPCHARFCLVRPQCRVALCVDEIGVVDVVEAVKHLAPSPG